MDTRDWHILWGVPPKYDNEWRNVILQRLMPLYRLRQTGESTNLLPSATHIDIAVAMTLWIPRRPQPAGCGGKNDNEGRNVILQRLMPFYRLRQTGESTTLLPTATHIDIAIAMALWILADHSQQGVVARMTLIVMVLGALASTC